ncbi:hypothetical protein [Bacillus sp. AG4(2022)]|uniref:hypothetical protein n=1 Tax=Bacillus sp. AG4(2022) TaxID=2962594 RepID=UPI002880ED24|nr:hypothetical protein [Bacillus sp. AG4(2022)]MDT0160662.1 hypothetical protein [Bacillus sp. AG4(2022)]
MSKLNQAIAEENIIEIRNLLKAYLTGDPSDSDSTIQQSLNKIQASGIDIWQPHDGKTLNTTSQAAWDEDYFVDSQVDLRMNFSQARFIHMLEVGKKVYGPFIPHSNSQQNQPSRPISTNPINTKPNTQPVNVRKKNSTLKWGAVVLGAVILMTVIIKIVNSNNN